MSPDPYFFHLATNGPIRMPMRLVRFFVGDLESARRASEARRRDERDLSRLREAAGVTTAGRTS